MRKTLCNNLVAINISNLTYSCDLFISGTTKEGLHPVIINFIETIRQILFEEMPITAIIKSRMALMENIKMQNIGTHLIRKYYL